MTKVLVAEDEPNVAIALRDSLESEGYAIETTADGSEGFRLASASGEAAPDLVMLDLMLPCMSGLEVCQRLRGSGVETPIIMLTARGVASDAAFGLKLGADDYIPKPIDVGELLARVAAVLRRARATRQGSVARITFMRTKLVSESRLCRDPKEARAEQHDIKSPR